MEQPLFVGPRVTIIDRLHCILCCSYLWAVEERAEEWTQLLRGLPTAGASVWEIEIEYTKSVT